MKKVTVILSLFIFVLSCQDEQVVEIPLPYEHNYVIYSEVKGGSPFPGVKITKTIPLDSVANESDTYITNAITYILVDSVRIIPLQYIGRGIYNTREPFSISSGSTVELFVHIEGDEYYAITTIPNEVNFFTPRLNPNNQLEAQIMAQSNTVYGALWHSQDINAPFKSADSFPQLNKGKANDLISITTSSIPPEILRSENLDSLYIQIISFDEQYWNYYETRDNNDPIDDIFSGGGERIDWNIRGENVIGLFIGSNTTKLISIRQ